MSTATAPPRTANAVLARNSDYPYRFAIVKLDEMYIDKYQRPESKFVEKIVDDYDPALIGTLVLSERPRRNKRFAVVDGQTRAAALRRLNLTEAPAIVFYELSIEQEAELFSKFQRLRKAITPYVRFNADLVAKDPKAVAIKNMVESEGFTIAEQDTNMRMLKAVRAVESIYEEDPDRLRQILRLIRETWDGVDFASREQMLKGMSLFLADTSDVDEPKFIERLRDATPSDIARRATMLRDSHDSRGTSPRFVAEVIQTIYRKPKKRGAR